MIETRPATTAIVVHFGAWEPTRRAVVALAASRPPVEILVVDNGGGAGDAGLGPAARVILAGGNLGYGGGCNLAARQVESEFLLLCNNDVEVRWDTVGLLETALGSEPLLAAAGPALRDAAGRPISSVGRAPTPWRVLFENLLLPRIFRRIPFFDGHHTIAFRHEVSCDVETVSGAVVLVRREAFEAAGGFDERFLFYAEESDLFRRLRQAGRRIRFEPKATALHHGGLASLSVPRSELDKRLHEGLALYARLHHGQEGERLTRLALRLGARLRWLISFVERPPRRAARRRRYADLLALYRLPSDQGGLGSPQSR